MFVKTEGKRICILIVYVDDINLIGDHVDEMSRIKLALGKEFEVKDLGDLKYFLEWKLQGQRKGSMCLKESTLWIFLKRQACWGVVLNQPLSYLLRKRRRILMQNLSL